MAVTDETRTVARDAYARLVRIELAAVAFLVSPTLGNYNKLRRAVSPDAIPAVCLPGCDACRGTHK